MIPIPDNLELFVAAAFILHITPGPAVLYIVTRSVDRGRRAGVASAAGIAVGGSLHVAAAALGLSAILATSAAAFTIVKYVGGAYLVYLGVRTLFGHEGGARLTPFRNGSHWQDFRHGIVVNALNPKTALFFLAFLPQFVDVSRGAVTLQFLFLGGLFVVMGSVSDTVYGLLAGTIGYRLKESPVFLSVKRYVAGTIYIALGLAAAFAHPSESE